MVFGNFHYRNSNCTLFVTLLGVENRIKEKQVSDGGANDMSRLSDKPNGPMGTCKASHPYHPQDAHAIMITCSAWKPLPTPPVAALPQDVQAAIVTVEMLQEAEPFTNSETTDAQYWAEYTERLNALIAPAAPPQDVL